MTSILGRASAKNLSVTRAYIDIDVAITRAGISHKLNTKLVKFSKEYYSGLKSFSVNNNGFRVKAASQSPHTDGRLIAKTRLSKYRKGKLAKLML